MLLSAPVQGAGISAKSAIVMDAASGRVLYEDNAHEKMLIASTTKLMTALVALDLQQDLDTTYIMTSDVCEIEGSSIYLQCGEEITLRALLYGLLLRSGNDAAIAIAKNCAGSVEQFVTLMNEKAAALSMHNTSFENPNGLDGPQHYSTAYDMALLARACLENETLRSIVSTKQISFSPRTFQNHNKLLWMREDCIGMKTGYTKAAGRTLVSAAQRGDFTVIAVTLDAPDDWNDHCALLDKAFETFVQIKVMAKGQSVAKIPVLNSLLPFVDIIAQEDVRIPIKTGEIPEYDLQLFYPAFDTEISKTTPVGTISFLIGEEVVAQLTLYPKYEIEKTTRR